MTEFFATPLSDQVFVAGTPMLDRLAAKSPLFFDPYLETSNAVVQAFIASALANSERLFPRKQRARRPADQKALEAIVAAVYANLAAVVISGAEPQTIAVGLAKPTKKLGMYGTKDVRLAELRDLADAGTGIYLQPWHPAFRRRRHRVLIVGPEGIRRPQEVHRLLIRQAALAKFRLLAHFQRDALS